MISARTRQVLSVSLLALGIVQWVAAAPMRANVAPACAVGVIAILLFLIPSLNGAVTRAVGACNRVLSKRPALVAAIITIAVGAALFGYERATAARRFPRLQDEHSYMIQAKMLAGGRLWMHPYPRDISPFFDSFWLIVDRAYASMYFPGTALMMVPAVWMRLPFWATPLAAASLAAGLIYLIFDEMFDPVRGILAVLLLLSLDLFRENSLTAFSQMPFLAAEMLLIWGWFRFRGNTWVGWAMLVGACAGYLAITRPLDALCVSIPVAVAMLWRIRRERRKLWMTVVAGLLAVSPFAAIQITLNLGVTKHWYESPEAYYYARNFPAPAFGYRTIQRGQVPRFDNPAKTQWMDLWVLNQYQKHTPDRAIRDFYSNRWLLLLGTSLPAAGMILFLPMGLLAMADGRRIMFVVILMSLISAYATFVFYLPHYAIPFLPSVVCMVMLGMDAIRRAWPAWIRLQNLVLLSVFAFAVMSIPPIARIDRSAPKSFPDQEAANAALAGIHHRAVVMFQFDPKVSPWPDEVVYNDGVAWPDDAAIIRVRDRGADDVNLFKYYAEHQPDRIFYRYDPDKRARGENPLSAPLGTAKELAAKAGESGE